jgi:hypothetical protein
MAADYVALFEDLLRSRRRTDRAGAARAAAVYMPLSTPHATGTGA